MTLRERYRRLTVWNKIAAWGSVASIIGLLITIAPVPKWNKCTAQVTVSSDMVSRLYAVATFDPEAKEQTYKFAFQELFYEWTLALTASDLIRRLSFELHHLEEEDRVLLKPIALGQVSEPQKWWYSGFREPKRTRPDYFIRTVVLTEVPGNTPISLVVRRALARPIISTNDLIKVGNVSSECQTETVLAPGAEDAERLQKRAVGLANNLRPNGESAGLPIRTDPGDPSGHEVQSTLEMRCKDDSCGTMQAQQMAVRLAKSSDEILQEQQSERLEAIGQELKAAFPCPESSRADEEPGQANQKLPFCVGSAGPSAGDIEQLKAIFQRHGVALNIPSPPQR